MGGGRDHSLCHSPLEGPDDDADPSIDFVPPDPGFDDRLANRFELQRAKIPGRSRAIQLPETLDRILDVLDLPGDLASLAVVRLGPLNERQEQLVDEDVRPDGGDTS